MVDRTVLFEAGQAGPPFLEKLGVSCEFKVIDTPGFQQFNNLRNDPLMSVFWILTFVPIAGLSWSHPLHKRSRAPAPGVLDQGSPAQLFLMIFAFLVIGCISRFFIIVF